MNVNTNIVSAVQSIIGDDYPVIIAYDAEEQENECNGVVAVNIQSMEDMGNTGCDDYKITLSVNGQTLASEDKDKSVLNEMFGTVVDALKKSTVDDWGNDIGDVANFGVGSVTFISDGETHNFEINCVLIVCNLIFKT